ncbi:MULTISPECIES: FKBP-type peptidyl-prolyl cis-trans isomerase [Spongiibacter]|uniref:FKBP-type peptidyl-prolyl cis-trans isomerase n=1 Tax=Spongiibacter TaxID=630749 RepID=UPI000C463971|nr:MULTISPECIES: FKBP-type peptidyl-prolyl cis-trans isomerase [Spongiibacter]MAY38381.1 peptidylprolyl isomerase [Spongiibacter sp.]MBI59066.1 peptidylprolyl isomerase [Spongiibacter sp.]|tara:strand:+ start:831 stop:1295 length:465 start_codon:yes stop_codon:yes gene_type:complete
MSLAIGPGTAVTLHFALLLEDGSEVDSTFSRQPAVFVFGDGKLLPGVELKLLGLVAGDQQELVLAPEDAFGQRNPANIQRLPRSQFGDIELSEGLVMNFADAANAELPGVISAIDDEMVDVDFNHPLAGRTLGFKVEIIDVQPHSGEDEVQHAG